MMPCLARFYSCRRAVSFTLSLCPAPTAPFPLPVVPSPVSEKEAVHHERHSACQPATTTPTFSRDRTLIVVCVERAASKVQAG